MNLSFSPSLESWNEDIRLSVYLLRCYVEDTEEIISKSIQRFKNQSTSNVVKDNGYQVINGYRGLYDDAWDLQILFEVDFPNLQRKSALISLCSFLENGLKTFCEILKVQKNLSQTFKNFSKESKSKGERKGITVLAKEYLENVGGLMPSNSQNKNWVEIESVYKIRNFIVHKDGKVNSITKENQDVINYIVASPYFKINENLAISNSREIMIETECLSHVVDIFDTLFTNLYSLAKTNP